MANNAQKTPLTKSLNDFALRSAADALQLMPKRLPVSVTAVGDNGATVTVKFEVTTKFTLPKIVVPVETSVYRREPIQVGDKGWVQAADARLGGVSGLGTGTPDLTPPANLGALVFSPIGNKDWDPSPDPDAYFLQGPNGVYFQDVGANCTLILTPTGIALVGKDNISFTVGSSSITMSSSEIDLNATTIKLNGKVWATHGHSGVTTGGGVTGPVA